MSPKRIAMYDNGQYSGVYLDMIRKHGGEPTLFKYVDNKREAESIAAAYDGLLLPGGEDVAPASYGRAVKSCCGDTDSLRDEVELLLGRAFVDAGKPVLGICRGCQIINVLFGGTLYQDIPTECREKGNHFDLEGRESVVHTVTAGDNTLLQKIVGSQSFGVNSIHHQAVEHVAEGLTASALSEDGVIEAIEGNGGFLLGVQWHPELIPTVSEQSDRLFSGFINACGA